MERLSNSQGSFIERKAWVLLALIAGVTIVFGLMAYLSPQDQTAAQPIEGSKCCTGEVLSNEEPWVTDYTGELGKYMGTFMAGTGVFAMALILGPFRRRERWAWGVLWYLPALFAIHGFALGSFPFDIVPLAMVTLGLVLPIRLFWGSRRPVIAAAAPTSA
jgi:hypothetical protein